MPNESELWFRNPRFYIRECTEMGVDRFAWDRGFLRKWQIDPSAFVERHLAPSAGYRLLLVGDQGTAELRRGSRRPVAVYPTWDYTQDHMTTLEELLARPASEDPAFTDPLLPEDERAVRGQEHRVVVIRANLKDGLGRRFLYELHELQEEYPDAIVHVHGLYSYGAMFGYSFRSVDTDPRASASKGKINLPNGMEIPREEASQHLQWINVCGFSTAQLTVPRNRCMYNIRSAQWAARHYRENAVFVSRRARKLHPDGFFVPIPDVETTTKRRPVRRRGVNGDMLLCSLCTLRNECKFFRHEAVCSIPESEPARLAQMFNTRNPDAIITGLGALVAAQVDRIETALQREIEADDRLDPELTKLMTSAFNSGVQLAKLIAPARFSAGGKTVALGQAAVVAESTPAELVSSVVAQLEAHGFAREDITEDLIRSFLEKGGAIEPKALTEES